jgi:hypothetical protein
VSFTIHITVFCHHVVNVVFLSAKKQMARITTLPYVAAMQDLKTIWYRAIGEFPCKAVSECSAMVDIDPSVSVCG